MRRFPLEHKPKTSENTFRRVLYLLTHKFILTLKQLFLSLTLLLAEVAAVGAQTQTTVVEGTVIDRPYSTILLLSKASEDMRVNTPFEIPIRDGRFLFSFEAYPEAYELTFADEFQRGSFRPILFFPGTNESDTVRMVLYPMDSAAMNRVTGGTDNREFRYMNSAFTCNTPVFRAWDSLQKARYDNGTYYNADAKALLEQLEKEQDRSVKDSLFTVWYAMMDARRQMSLEATATDRKMQAYADSVEKARYEYIRNRPSLAGYYWLYRKQLFGSLASRPLREEIYRTVYAPRYPEYPYTAKLDTLFYRQIQVGKRFADFEAPDLNGQMHRLSELIDGKIAIVDLWASWCGPCRRNSIALIPIYEEFKEKGFTVVGVARESGNDDAMRKAIVKDGYTWTNLLELNDRAGIWTLYGVSNAGGGQFLIDKDGTVLAIHPTVSEIRQILSEKLR